MAHRIAEAGHLIGSHGFSHAAYDLLSETGRAADLSEARDAIFEATETDPWPWFRFPFGRTAALPDGWRCIGWNVDGDDWNPTATPESVRGLVGRVGSIATVLLHTWPLPAVVALPDIIGDLQAKGAEFVTVDALA